MLLSHPSNIVTIVTSITILLGLKKIIWLDALGLGCGTQDLHCGVQALESGAWA